MNRLFSLCMLLRTLLTLCCCPCLLSFVKCGEVSKLGRAFAVTSSLHLAEAGIVKEVVYGFIWVLSSWNVGKQGEISLSVLHWWCWWLFSSVLFYTEDSVIVSFNFMVDHSPRCRRCSGGEGWMSRT